jgi:hypothetical protein
VLGWPTLAFMLGELYNVKVAVVMVRFHSGSAALVALCGVWQTAQISPLLFQ